MTIANDIINGRMPDFDAYIRAGEVLDDIDEYGFTPLIESVITRQITVAEELLNRNAAINKSDMTGRTPLHWAVDNQDLSFTKLLLEHGANPNAYTKAGSSVLVYPVLRGENEIKHLLYQYGANLDFALDFIHGKLLGHRFELSGDVDIINPDGEFIELDFEGFILEFTVAVLKDSLRRFTASYSTRHLRAYFPVLHEIMDAFDVASELLKFQHIPWFNEKHEFHIRRLFEAPLLILPVASRGHAITFIRYEQFLAKIDRGENSLKEGTVNIYEMTKKENFNFDFLKSFLYEKQPRRFFHEIINSTLGLQKIGELPISPQITGNCSWANVQAAVPVAFSLLKWKEKRNFFEEESIELYDSWVEWDQDRALDECVQRFYRANALRKASIAAMLGTVLFQTCDDERFRDVKRAEKILSILTEPDYAYILQSYLRVYCVERLTRRGNNLLKLLDDCGINPEIGVTPIATGLKKPLKHTPRNRALKEK